MKQSAKIQKADLKKCFLLLYQILLIRRFEDKVAGQYFKVKIKEYHHQCMRLICQLPLYPKPKSYEEERIFQLSPKELEYIKA